MAKVDLGRISTVTVAYGNVVSGSPTTLQALGSGEWVCTPVYPLNLDIVATPDSNNNVVVTSNGYTGFVLIACYAVESTT